MHRKRKIRRPLHSPIRIAVALAFGVAPCLSPVRGEDRVFLQAPSGLGESRVVGEIVEFTGVELVLRHPSGREQTFASDRVRRVESDWPAPHQAALASYQQRRYQESLDGYLTALRSEKRKWVQREQLAAITWCYRNLGRLDQAAASFLALYRSDPATRHFAAIPLVWSSGLPDMAAQRRGEALLADATQPVGQLIGASWLLTTAKRPAALQTLRGLTNAADARVIFLAEAQGWRTQSAAPSDADLTRMQARIEAMPRAIRGGPYYLLGAAEARGGRPAQAALAFLRIPLNYPEDRAFSAEALLAAGGALETINHSSEARELYRELIVDYADLPTAATAQQRYAAQASDTPPDAATKNRED